MRFQLFELLAQNPFCQLTTNYFFGKMKATLNKPLKLNKEANYHGKADDIKDYLYTFMAKNLFRMICPLHSEFSSQTRTKGKLIEYVELLPVGSKNPVVDGFETNVNPKTGIQVITYHTNNELMFWKKP